MGRKTAEGDGSEPVGGFGEEGKWVRGKNGEMKGKNGRSREGNSGGERKESAWKRKTMTNSALTLFPFRESVSQTKEGKQTVEVLLKKLWEIGRNGLLIS